MLIHDVIYSAKLQLFAWLYSQAYVNRDSTFSLTRKFCSSHTSFEHYEN